MANWWVVWAEWVARILAERWLREGGKRNRERVDSPAPHGPDPSAERGKESSTGDS